MTKATDEQPAPKATDKRPMWPEVIAYVQRNYEDDKDGLQAVALLTTDMGERDRVGRERYGVPLTAGNGRNALIDAYQELLDFVVYLRTELEERGIEPFTPEVSAGRSKDNPPTIIEAMVMQLFCGATETLLQLRGAIRAIEEGKVK